jgi:hypothetical protein
VKPRNARDLAYRARILLEIALKGLSVDYLRTKSMCDSSDTNLHKQTPLNGLFNIYDLAELGTVLRVNFWLFSPF